MRSSRCTAEFRDMEYATEAPDKGDEFWKSWKCHPLGRWTARVEPYYPTKARGQRRASNDAADVSVSHWFTLSDRRRGPIYDTTLSVIHESDLLGEGSAGCTHCANPKLLNRLYHQAVFDAMRVFLDRHGKTDAWGTIVDATIIMPLHQQKMQTRTRP